jgi:hypothetical protein
MLIKKTLGALSIALRKRLTRTDILLISQLLKTGAPPAQLNFKNKEK